MAEKMTGEKLSLQIENAGWDSLKDVEMATELAPETEESKRERIGAYEQKLFREAFRDVDQEEIRRVTSEWIDRIEEKDLLQLREGIEKDFRNGVQEAVQYFAGLLDLDMTPEVAFSKCSGDRYGCEGGSNLARAGKPDLITVSEFDELDVSGTLETVAHECWHSRQNMLVGYLMDGDISKIPERAMKYIDDRAIFYVYNKTHYVKAEVDIEGYRTQLIEAEAYEFGELLGSKARKLDGREYAE